MPRVTFVCDDPRKAALVPAFHLQDAALASQGLPTIGLVIQQVYANLRSMGAGSEFLLCSQWPRMLAHWLA
jgi:hypothetical protein